MRTPVAVAVPDGVWARELEARVRDLQPTVVERDGGWHVELETGYDSTLAQLLSAVDAWLSESGPESVRVVVGEREYLMERVLPPVGATEPEPAGTRASLPRSSPA